FAAAAISGEDAIKTGIQGSVYALRTVILPFIWIFNPMLLLIDVQGIPEVVLVVGACTLATLLFAALTMGWLRVRCKPWELAVLAVAVALLFRPDWFMDRIAPEYQEVPAAQLQQIARDAKSGERLVLQISGTTIEGDDVTKTVALTLGDRPADGVTADGRKRLADVGLTTMGLGEQLQVGGVKFGSRAQKAGFEQGWDIRAVMRPSGRVSEHWFYLPAVLLAALVWWNQGRRMAGMAHLSRSAG
ncbi:MAG: DUF3394 domain-containing protein, partial [Rubrivivax sp.]